MNLEELIDILQKVGQIKPSRLANIKMSARRYAEALGCYNLLECPETVFALGKLARNQKIELLLEGKKSLHTVRNTKNDISFLLRQAELLNLITPIPKKSPPLAEKSFGRRKIIPKLPSLISHEEASFNKEAYSLPLKYWDKDLRLQYEEWLKWVTTPNNKFGNVDPFNRPATIETKTSKMEAFFGFLKNIKGILDLDLEMLIDVSANKSTDTKNKNIIKCRTEQNTGLLEEFVIWHINRYEGKFTAQARAVISVALSLVEKYYLLEALKFNKDESIRKYRFIADGIIELRNRLIIKEKPPKQTIPKYNRTISKDDLWLAAIREFPKDISPNARQIGNIKASDAGRALAIMLMLEYPLRSKNLREAKIGQNIIKTSDGKWAITSNGEKESAEQSYKKRTNNFESFNYEIGSGLDEYLIKYIEDWHPKITAEIDRQIAKENRGDKISKLQSRKSHLFLTSRGLPFSRQTFSIWIERGIFRWFGVRINPELIRQISSK